jgi:hypothetical protein
VIKALLDAKIDFEVEKYGWGLYFSLINGFKQKEIKPTSAGFILLTETCPVSAPRTIN